MRKKITFIILLILIIFLFPIFINSSYYYNIEGFAFEPFGLKDETLQVVSETVQVNLYSEGAQSNLSTQDIGIENFAENQLYVNIESTYQIFNSDTDKIQELVLPIWSHAQKEYSQELILNGVKTEIKNIKYGDSADYIDFSFLDYENSYNNAFDYNFSFSNSLKGKIYTFISDGIEDLTIDISFNIGTRKIFFDSSYNYQNYSDKEKTTLSFHEQNFKIFVIGGDINLNTLDSTSINEEEITYNDYLTLILNEQDVEQDIHFGLLAKKFYEIIATYDYYNFYFIDDLLLCFQEYRLIYLVYDIEIKSNLTNEIVLTQNIPLFYSDWWNGNTSQFHFNYITSPQQFWNSIARFELSINTDIAQSTLKCNDINFLDGKYVSNDILSENLKQIHFFIEIEDTDSNNPSVFEVDNPVLIVLIMMTIILVPTTIFLGGIVFIILFLLRTKKKKKQY